MTPSDSAGPGTVVTRVTGAVMPVNSYLVDCGPGVVVVDAQLCVSDAAAVRAAVEASGKPLLAVLLTHPHPDHYAGAEVLTRGLDVPVVATRAVADVVAADDGEKQAVVGPMMGDEWPASRRFPDQIVADDATLTWGEQHFTVASWGAAESHADTTWSLADGTVFAGDLVYDAEHAYLADGHGERWLRVLDRFAATLDPGARLLPGHGAGGGPELVDRQAAYVRTFLDAVSAALDDDPVAREQRVLDAVRPLARSDGLLFLARLSIEPTVGVMRDHGGERSA
ncbi:MBL fold metallo-hydrolase [Nocardioides sp. CGMCC 1.13656]|nr:MULTISPECIES: MBL fold metallo-hydrolase [unclassified Nocardioides]MBA2955925.1 MBL fold metallo-hydrolase [Nocardioides sp. CGMCC 1.13656]